MNRIGSLAAVPLGCAPAEGPNPDATTLILPKGDAGAGRTAFINLRCTTCHAVSGAGGLPEPLAQVPVPDLGVTLEGQSRSSIATSIVLPSHIISTEPKLWSDWSDSQRVWLGSGQQIPREEEEESQSLSLMTDYSSVMTVQQLSDLVVFLQDSAGTK